MSNDDLLILQMEEQRARLQQEQRRHDALTGGHRKLREAIFEDVVRILLSFDPTVKPEDLYDEAKFKKMARQRLDGASWEDRPMERLPPFKPELAMFRAQVAVLQNFVEGWIHAAREEWKRDERRSC